MNLLKETMMWNKYNAYSAWFAAVFVCVLLANGNALATPAAVTASTSLPAEIKTMLRESNLDEAAIGVLVMRVADGNIIVSHGANKSMQPASTMKVLTAIVGLDRLGPAYRSRTELTTTGIIDNGVLTGDITLRGLGNTDIEAQDFDHLLLTLRHKGIQTIRGNLVVDRHFYQPSRIDIGVTPFDESVEFRYNVIPDALMLNMNLAEYAIETNHERFLIRLSPQLENVSVISNMTLNDKPCGKWEDSWKMPTTVKSDDGEIRVYLNGSFPKNCTQAVNINVIDRADYVERLFRALWAKLGGSFTGAVLEAKMPETARLADTLAKKTLLAQHQARPLAEVTRNINKVSDNTITRMTLLNLGALNSTGAGTTLQKGEAEIRAWLKQRNIDDAGLVIENGSGLSRLERISAAQLASVLQAAHRSKWAPEFMSSLPIVGVDGSMRSRLKGTPAAEVGRIKTGSLRDVVAVAGYMPDATGQLHVVAAMINDPKAISAGGRAILDKLLEWVAKMKSVSK
jgi:serine-type D-Ala-D-Ala carboxypeptidase/endopeptidase (penicillin-binding protein 4)